MTNKEEPAGLYIHVPFCKTKCPYCDFYSITDTASMSQFAEVLMAEAGFYKGLFGGFDTLYFGGGTPSLLDERCFAEIMAGLKPLFNFFPDTEITVEMNPDDVTREKLALYRALGVNRISLGVQSFNDRELTFLKRRHDARSARNALELVGMAGFSNLGIDLMYALPGQTRTGWLKTLETACSFRPAHISCYQLTINEETPFGKMTKKGVLKETSEARQRALFLLTSRFLNDKGFIHYEVSNFAYGQENRSRHNLKYWRHIPYLGLGPGAHSFREGTRWWNRPSVDAYIAAITKGIKPPGSGEKLTLEQLEMEELLLGFRNLEGVDTDRIRHRTLSQKNIERLVSEGLILLRQGRMVPTVEGYLLADRLPLLVTG